MISVNENDPVLLKMIYNFLMEYSEKDLNFKIKLEQTKADLNDCYNYIKKKAKSFEKNGCACIEDKKVYEWAVHFYDENGKPADFVNDNQKIEAKTVVQSAGVKKSKLTKKKEVKKRNAKGVEQISLELF